VQEMLECVNEQVDKQEKEERLYTVFQKLDKQSYSVVNDSKSVCRIYRIGPHQCDTGSLLLWYTLWIYRYFWSYCWAESATVVHDAGDRCRHWSRNTFHRRCLCENMNAMLDVDDCNCSHIKEYEGFLDCLQKVHGGNPATKVGDLLKTMNDKNVSTTLLEAAMSSSSSGRGMNE